MSPKTINIDSPGPLILLLWNNNYHKIVSQLLKQARKEILLSSFKIETPQTAKDYAMREIVSDLTKKKASGLDIKILLHWCEDIPRPPRQNLISAYNFQGKGIEIKHFKSRRVIHAKIIIVDKTFLVTGSHNLSSTSLQHNFELSVLIKNPEIAQSAREHFLHYFDQAVDFPHPPP